VKLHDLHPAPGSRRKRTRVGRGIAAGQGKTAGRGTKGQKARAGASIPAWFEGGQTPIHIRVPKLRGFKNRFKIQYSVVNVGTISEYAAAGRFGVELEAGPKAAKGKATDSPATVNAEVLASAGLIGSIERPLKVLGQGDVTEKLFVAADSFSASARRKIEEAGGFVQVLAPEKPMPDADEEKKSKPKPKADSDDDEPTATPAGEAAAEAAVVAEAAPETAADQAEPVTSETDGESVAAEAPAKAPRKRSSSKTSSEG
jgi:large subunit ribosomal protein L15